MTKAAELIVVDHNEKTVLVDGEPFPWAIEEVPTVERVGPNDVARVTFTVFASEVRVRWGE